jgi:hypothetical protein
VEKKKFKSIVSYVEQWIVSTIAEFEAQMEPVSAAPFERLTKYYPDILLQRVQRVIVDRCPVPPLEITGIPQLVEIDTWDIKGIPWKNTIFIRRDLADWEGVHFHELLHIVQWEHLGTESYLAAWAVGTITRGYRDNLLEEMAFRHQSRFETEENLYDVVKEVTSEMSKWPECLFDIRKL